MKKLDLLKAGAEIVVSIGVGAIVGNAVVFTTPLTTKTVQKICIKVGSIVLSGMIGDKAADYVGAKIDSGAETIKSIISGEEDEEEEEVQPEEEA